MVPISTRFEAPLVSADYTGDAGPPAAIADLAGHSPDDRERSARG